MSIVFGKYLRVDSGSFVSFSYWVLKPLLCFFLILSSRNLATKRPVNEELCGVMDARTSNPTNCPHMRGNVLHSPCALEAEHSIEVT